MSTPLATLFSLLPRDAIRVEAPTRTTCGDELKSYSVLFAGYRAAFAPDTAKLTDAMPLIVQATTSMLNEAAAADVEADRSIGALMGLAVGDAVGAPLEFVPAKSDLPPYDDTRSHLKAELAADGALQYVGESNKFRLFRGQWTDDCSMALCLADSLLTQRGYSGGDCRTRYYMWWNYGYNNAFRFDRTPHRTSVGLGGNIATSLAEIENFAGKLAAAVPARFTAKGEDAGNGSIMRLAPVPIRYQHDMDAAMRVAMEQSYATHPGPDAAACCAAMTYMIVRAIKRDASPGETLKAFVAATAQEFVDKVATVGDNAADTGMQKVVQVLTATPPSAKEAVWDWKATTSPIEATLAARGHRYNGYPVMPGYFGSYCMDGLGMALWALNNSDSFSDCALKITNLLGDCDTTGAIALQVAGAFYGYRAMSADAMGAAMLRDVQRWDPLNEIPVRGLMLYDASKGADAPTQ